MQTVTTIGLDIAKSVFQVHGVDAAGQVITRRRLNEQLRGIIARMDFCPDPKGDGMTLIISFVGGGNSAVKIFLP